MQTDPLYQAANDQLIYDYFANLCIYSSLYFR
jgi:hypothetical protein